MTDASNSAGLLHGLAEIARYLSMRPRTAKHHHEAGSLPTFRIGRGVCARKATLDRWLADREAAAARAKREARELGDA